MKKKIASLKNKAFLILLGVLLCLCATPCNVKAETTCNVTCPSFTFIDTDGNTVTNESLKGKVTILMFSTDWCVNSTNMINAIGRSDWFPNKNVNLVFGMLDGTEESTKTFQSTYCYNGMTFCYTADSSTMSTVAFSCFHATGGVGNSVATPLLFILDQNGNIRYESEGLLDAATIADIVDGYTSLDYSITDDNIQVSLPGKNEFVYTGSAFEPTVAVKKWSYELLLTKGKQYTVSYENNVNAGTAYAVVSGIGYMKGTKKIPFTIQPRSINSSIISYIADQTYTGQPLQPKVTVVDNTKILTEGVDYTTGYINNVNAGIATIQITGKGNYTGSISSTFQIVKKEVPKPVVPEAKGTQITDVASSGKYVVTNSNATNPTVSYTGTTNKNKKSITVPEYITYKNVKYKVTSVKTKSFKGNKKLTTVKIASNITQIGNNAFENCTNLKTVTVGKGLKTIGKNAFKNCKKLKKITIKSTKLKSVGKNAFKRINAKCKIKVPSKKLKAYKKLMKNKGQKSTVKITK